MNTPPPAIEKAWAKSKLTTLQYFGGAGMTPADHVIIGDVLFQVFGETSCAVPPVCTAQWGFVAWAKWMGEWK